MVASGKILHLFFLLNVSNSLRKEQLFENYLLDHSTGASIALNCFL